MNKSPSAFAAYMLKQAEKESAYNLFSYAAQKLENAKIFERLAELRSQVEPMTSLMNAPLGEEDRMYAAAYYVVTGRKPEDK